MVFGLIDNYIRGFRRHFLVLGQRCQANLSVFLRPRHQGPKSGLLSRNDFGERDRLGRTGRRPADQPAAQDDSPFGSVPRVPEAIGGTPMAATETVALPLLQQFL